MPTPPLSEEKKQRIVDLIGKGYSNAEISAVLGVASGSASKVRCELRAQHNKVCTVESAAREIQQPQVQESKCDLSGLHILLPDAHFPEIHWPTWRAILDFLNRNKVRGLTWTGDQLDLSEISHHNRDNPGLRGKGALRANLDGFADLLDALDSLLPPDAHKVWHRGNHERFVQDLYEANPELESMLDVEEHLKLTERGYITYKLGKMSELGKLGIIHGDSVGSGKYIAAKVVETYCRPMVFGHVHTASSATKVGAASKTDKWMAWSLPTMGTVNPAFARNRPNAHTNGFGIVELRPDGNFNLYTVITDSETGEFSYGGQLYSGRQYVGV